MKCFWRSRFLCVPTAVIDSGRFVTSKREFSLWGGGRVNQEQRERLARWDLQFTNTVTVLRFPQFRGSDFRCSAVLLCLQMRERTVKWLSTHFLTKQRALYHFVGKSGGQNRWELSNRAVDYLWYCRYEYPLWWAEVVFYGIEIASTSSVRADRVLILSSMIRSTVIIVIARFVSKTHLHLHQHWSKLFPCSWLWYNSEVHCLTEEWYSNLEVGWCRWQWNQTREQFCIDQSIARDHPWIAISRREWWMIFNIEILTAAADSAREIVVLGENHNITTMFISKADMYS